MQNKETPKVFTPLLQHWKRNGKDIVLTNDFGGRVCISQEELKKLAEQPLTEAKVGNALVDNGFIYEMLDTQKLSRNWVKAHCNVCLAPTLHIIVLTSRCNMQCVYCQAGSSGKKEANLDMTWETAQKSVDFAFRTPSPALNFEFQGGEPLLNWPVLKKTVEYIRKKEQEEKRRVSISLVSNFLLMDEQKADFLLSNEVIVCTSLDGPEAVHSKNRPSPNGSSYNAVKKWFAYFKQKHDEQKGLSYRIFKPSALLTVTKNSIGHAKSIVDEYVNMGCEGMYLRPVSKIGYAQKNWESVGVSAEEFLSFYKEALSYIIELNKSGKFFLEKTCLIFCSKILSNTTGGNYDLESPCGAGTGQVAYNYDGNIYTCDEGRMLAMSGDEIFKIGTVDDSVEIVLTAEAVRGCKYASDLNSQHACARCVYMPYCGVCPVFNYASQGSLVGNMTTNSRCAINKGQLDFIFDLLKGEKNKEVILKWLRA